MTVLVTQRRICSVVFLAGGLLQHLIEGFCPVPNRRPPPPFILDISVPYTLQEESALFMGAPSSSNALELRSNATSTTAGKMTGASGLAFSIGVIYALASSYGVSEGGGGETKAITAALANVADASLPADTTDIVSIALGESIGGLIGAMSTLLVSSIFRFQMKQARMDQKALIVEALADSDYFVARAAALPLLQAIVSRRPRRKGIPTVMASLSSVLVASVPYELIKLGSQRRAKILADEDYMMEQLLLEQQRKEKRTVRWLFQPPEEIVPVTPVKKPMVIDVPEILADVIKWLEYDVLVTDFGGTLLGPEGNPLPPGIESAIFGFITGASTLMYLDVIRINTDYGPPEKSEEAQTRTLVGWASLYLTECTSSAALFGVYETVRQPVAQLVASFQSGGVDECLGSTDFASCVATYVENNPAEATLEAQVRSLVTALASLWDRAFTEGPDVVYYDAQQFARAAIVQLYNILNHIWMTEVVSTI